MTERIKIFAIAHLVPGLEQAWLQHMRDFDIRHPGCHFEICSDAPPQESLLEMLDKLRVDPELTFTTIFERGKK